jgi:voltage-gated potassium channel
VDSVDSSDLRDARAEKLARWEKRATPFIVVAALVPFLPTLTGADRHWLPILIELVAWGVFLVDLAVHVRLRPGYLRTKLGVFDAVIVVGTFPWYLIPGFGGLAALGVLRLARLARIGLVAFKSPALNQLFRRLGWPALVVGASVLIAGGIVFRQDTETFPTFGDGLWWALVTVATVGYGDFVPESPNGRAVAVLLMLIGVGLLGAVAATLAAFLDELRREKREAEEAADPAPSPSDPDELAAALQGLRDEVAALKRQVQSQQDSTGP